MGISNNIGYSLGTIQPLSAPPPQKKNKGIFLLRQDDSCINYSVLNILMTIQKFKNQIIKDKDLGPFVGYIKGQGV